MRKTIIQTKNDAEIFNHLITHSETNQIKKKKNKMARKCKRVDQQEVEKVAKTLSSGRIKEITQKKAVK